MVARLTIGSLAGVGLGAAVFTALPERMLLALLRVFILSMAWLPKLDIPGLGQKGLNIGGAISTFLTLFVGATGPFIQALFLPACPRPELVATPAMWITIENALKVEAFGVVGVLFLA